MKDKVVKAARELGLKVDVKTLEQPTRTVSEAAGAVGCIEAQIAKTLVFVADGDPVLVVASGKHRVDPEALCDIFEDRKSTRLNSSHANISYAVFCLKKKKKIYTCNDTSTENAY